MSVPSPVDTFLEKIANKMIATKGVDITTEAALKLSVRQTCAEMTSDELAVVLSYILIDFSKAEQDFSWELEKHASKSKKADTGSGDPQVR